MAENNGFDDLETENNYEYADVEEENEINNILQERNDLMVKIDNTSNYNTATKYIKRVDSINEKLANSGMENMLSMYSYV